MSYRPALAATLSGLLLLGSVPAAHAYVINISPGARSLYLRVGDGVYSGTFDQNGTPGSGGPINLVSVTVPAAALGNGVSQQMTSNATQANSNLDNYPFCNLPAQVYVGGYYRGGNAAGSGSLSVDSSIALANAGGNTIAFSQISWTSSGNGDGNDAQPFPAGTFNGSTQTLASFPANTWRESCHTFSYRNSNVVAAGTYRGRVTYTLSAP